MTSPPRDLKRQAAVPDPGRFPLRVLPLGRQRAGPSGSRRRRGCPRQADQGHPCRLRWRLRVAAGDLELWAHGVRVNRKRVERIMRQRDVVGRHLRRRKRTTVADAAAPPVPDLIGRDFTASAPDQRWCGDITYLHVGGGWLYLATVIDIATRRLIGWSINTHMRSSLVIDALDAAVAARGGRVEGVIFHSDRGAQYSSGRFADACRRHGVRRSMGRIGSSYDNALAEAFFATPQTRVGRRPPPLDHRGRRPPRPVPVDRLLQPPPPPLRAGLPQPRRLRTGPHSDYAAPHRGITRCPHPGGTSGKWLWNEIF
ncbi:Transposase InsO and inactivated derivatives [Micromonospora rhizosphaerae]|uniref:Transposase InsO and inactivated derivatives n=1 Tax=Micromonospora rhizosphaerae TaxID=568872 RepID=A0A1C6T1Y8_9ACTN|nr:Transposase InsO and inactivated derivatives [Micromonospora rhizosphaerae]